jgi:hypothetical protein
MVNGLNSVSLNLIQRAFKDDEIDNWRELTPITEGDYVHYQGSEYEVACDDFIETSSRGILSSSRLVLRADNERAEIYASEVEYIYLQKLVGEDIYEQRSEVESMEVKDGKLYFTCDIGEVNAEKVKYVENADGEIYAVTSFEYSEDDEEFIFDGTKEFMIVDYYDVESSEYESIFPMWGTLWSTTFDDLIEDNLLEVASCGFRIFMDDVEGTIYLGIDGAGYNFYEHHWTPLYDALGFAWHSETVEA